MLKWKERNRYPDMPAAVYDILVRAYNLKDA